MKSMVPWGEVLLERLCKLALVQEGDFEEMRIWVERVNNEALQRAPGNS